jgi:hypothetical protein
MWPGRRWDKLVLAVFADLCDADVSHAVIASNDLVW